MLVVIVVVVAAVVVVVVFVWLEVSEVGVEGGGRGARAE